VNLEGGWLDAGDFTKSRFVDSVSACQTVEPAIDFDAAAALAFALSAVQPA
jgi:hypothetical protein